MAEHRDLSEMSEDEPDAAPVYPEKVPLKTPEHDLVVAEGVVEWLVPSVQSYSPVDRTDLRGPEQALMVGDYPMKMLVYPAGNGSKHIGVYVELATADPRFPPGPYTLFVVAVLEVVSADDKWTVQRQFQHRFHDLGKRSSGANWGFKQLLPLDQLCDPARGYIDAGGNCLCRAKVQITDGGDPNTWLGLSTYDSKGATGMVGILNQGMTCYMNSCLQTLYHTLPFRHGAYAIDTEKEDPEKSPALGIQRVFHRLQCNSKAVSTEELTKSFGWNTYDSFMQQDVQEFLRVLIDNLEKKMKGSPNEKLMVQLLEGKMKSFIKCVNVDYESSREETFMDIQLTVKGMGTLYKSFEDYCSKERLEGENQYNAEGHGPQDADKGTIFTSFPPVLHLQLRRFEYDWMRDETYKVNDRFEFPPQINLDKYLDEPDPEDPATYTLHSVLVQGGEINSGHYVVYIQPDPKERQWYKFDDDVCLKASEEEAVMGHYGEDDKGAASPRKSVGNAYMLVYLRDSAHSVVMPPPMPAPAHLTARFAAEDEERAKKLAEEEKEESENNSTANVVLVRLPDLDGWHGLELPQCFDNKGPTVGHVVKIERMATLNALYEKISEELSFEPEEIRLYPFESRQNHTIRPSEPAAPWAPAERLREHVSKQLESVQRSLQVCSKYIKGRWFYRVFFTHGEVPAPESDPALMFFKYYDPRTPELRLIGSAVVDLRAPVGDYAEMISRKAKLPPGTALCCHEEMEAEKYPEVDVLQSFAQASLQDGDILVWSASEYVQGERDGADFYLMRLEAQHEVEFRALDKPEEAGFKLMLDKRHMYRDVVTLLAQHLKMDDPKMLQLTYHQTMRRYARGGPSEVKVLSSNAFKLEDWGVSARTPSRTAYFENDLLYYAPIPMPIHEYEAKCQLTVHFLKAGAACGDDPMGTTDHAMVADPDQTIDELVEEVLEASGWAAAHPDAGNLAEVARRQFRLVYIRLCRLQGVVPGGTACSALTAKMAYWRVEEIPEDQRSVEVLQQHLVKKADVAKVFHVQKTCIRSHGNPFYMKLRAGEPAADLKARMQVYTNVKDEEWTKWKLGRVEREQQDRSPQVDQDYIETVKYLDDDEVVFPVPADDEEMQQRQVELVLDHVDRNAKFEADNSGVVIKN